METNNAPDSGKTKPILPQIRLISSLNFGFSTKYSPWLVFLCVFMLLVVKCKSVKLVPAKSEVGLACFCCLISSVSRKLDDGKTASQFS